MSIRVLHVISGLGLAGAESVLHRLLAETRGAAIEPEVVSLTGGGSNADRIRALGVPVTSLDLRRRLASGDPRPPFELLRLLRDRPPDVVQTWLYHADVIAGLAARVATRAAIVWNLRHGLDPRATERPAWIVRASARLSTRVPHRIVACAESVRAAHVAIGYPAARMEVIPNGIDVALHRPDEAARTRLRDALGIRRAAPLVGRVAHFRAEKDYRLLVEAFGRVHARRPDARFLLCGWGVEPSNGELAGWIRDAGLEGAVHLLGRREDVPAVLAALDVLCSSSRTEGFPNTLAEAMAAGVPCVATDVGDSAEIVGETGRVVAAGDGAALARGVVELLSLPLAAKREIGRAARARIRSRYSLAVMADRYRALYDELALGAARRGEGIAAVASGR